tara:strand:- start:144 stop:320 length:177 start_codon:yes stop_codon:yes gene_type:complete
MLLNTIKSLVVSEAQNLVTDQVQEALKENLSEEHLHALDAVVDAMPENTFKNVKDLFG